MKALVIGSDRNLFKEGSAVRARILEQGKLVDELHIVVFAKKGFNEQKLGDNIWLYPTNSLNRWFYVRNAIKLGKKIIGDGKDWVISTQDPFESGICGLKIAQNTQAKLNVQVHVDFLSPYFTYRFLNRMRLHCARKVLKKAHKIRVVSERIKKSLVHDSRFHIPESKISVLPIFVDEAKIKNTPVTLDLHQKYPQFEKILLVASRLESEKNIDLAIRALAQINKKFPKNGLVIVGSGSEESRLRALVASLKIGESVIFAGWQTDLISYYKTADIFLNTSLYEGYGMSLIEAAVSGLPIVTTDVGIVGELLKDGRNALVCNVGDKECFANALMRFFVDPNLGLRLREQNHKGGFVPYSQADYLEEYRKLCYTI